MNWYEEWFDSPLYERMYPQRDDKEAARLAGLLSMLFSVERYRDVLDLGCGRGRHSINFARLGYNVTGIDLSDNIISKAKERAEVEDLNIEFVVGDMRQTLGRKFDLIINLFTTFGYFNSDKENISVFDSIHDMMHEHSATVIDYMNAAYVLHHIVPSENGHFDGITYEIKRYITEDAINKEMIFHMEDGAKRVYREQVKLYDLNWFRRQTTLKGLQIKEVYGDYEGNPFRPNESPRLLMICECLK